MTEVWIVQGNCGDYYCDGNHVIGVYESEKEANEAAMIAERSTHSYASHAEPRSPFRTWTETDVNKITVGEVPPLHELRGRA